MDIDDLIQYEFPCNEKIRTYMRLESLFSRFSWFCEQTSPHAHQAAMMTLFDLADASARSDLKNELLQLLERQRQNICQHLACSQNESESFALHEHLESIQFTAQLIGAAVGRSTQTIRENKWLQTVRSRMSLPGGTCEFDMPMLHYWFGQSPQIRRADLMEWFAPMEPLKLAIYHVLNSLRAQTQIVDVQATNGTYQMPLNGTSYSLARVWLPAHLGIVPETSINKYMIWVRFSKPTAQRTLQALHENVPFKLGLCL